jgi:hypothetical protein
MKVVTHYALLMLVSLVSFFCWINGAVASPYQAELISVQQERNFKIAVDGQLVAARARDGSFLYPMTINGRAYLPVRFVAELNGCKVSWDAATHTVNLFSNSGELAEMSGANSAASTGAPRKVQAKLEKSFKINLDGQEVIPRDADGTRLYPITYRGWSYLPVRSLAEITGTGVGWVHDSQTLQISRQPGQTSPAQVATTAAPGALLEDWPAVVTVPPVVQTTAPAPADVADVPPVTVPVVTVPSPVVPPVVSTPPAGTVTLPPVATGGGAGTSVPTTPSWPLPAGSTAPVADAGTGSGGASSGGTGAAGGASPVSPLLQSMTVQNNPLWKAIEVQCGVAVYSAKFNGSPMSYRGKGLFTYYLVHSAPANHQLAFYDSGGILLGTVVKTL